MPPKFLFLAPWNSFHDTSCRDMVAASWCHNNAMQPFNGLQEDTPGEFCWKGMGQGISFITFWFGPIGDTQNYLWMLPHDLSWTSISTSPGQSSKRQQPEHTKTGPPLVEPMDFTLCLLNTKLQSGCMDLMLFAITNIQLSILKRRRCFFRSFFQSLFSIKKKQGECLKYSSSSDVFPASEDTGPVFK